MSVLSLGRRSSSTILLTTVHKSPSAHLSLILPPPPPPPPLPPSPFWLSARPSPVLRVNILDRDPYGTATSIYSKRFVARAGSLLQDAGATAAVLAGAYGLVLTFDTLTQRKLIKQNLSRKLVHVLSGLLFAACWPVFSISTEARFFASLVPLANCIRLVIYGLSLAKDEGLIKSVTREGNPEELLRGPLYYVLILILCTLVFWRESPVGLIALAMMCGGDGMADILGRRFGSAKLPFNQQKSWAGSISMFVFGFLMSIGLLYYYSSLGYFQLNWERTLQRVAIVSLVATVVESLPTTEVFSILRSLPCLCTCYIIGFAGPISVPFSLLRAQT